MTALRAFFTGLIDYAGLFPPARLSMQSAAEEYARCRAGEHAWMLGRFICPAARLAELSTSAAPLMPGTYATSGYREMVETGEPWRISVLIDGELAASLDSIDAFNARHSREDGGLALIDCVELKIASPDGVDITLDSLPADLYPHFEFPVSGDCRGFVAALAGEQASAKVRTGGITPDLIPSPADVARFLEACAAASVPFKATAGLHHPVRSEHALDALPGSARGVMHGFLNVFVGAAVAHAQSWNAARLTKLLEDTEPSHFSITDKGVGWRSGGGAFMLDAEAIRRSRQSLALSFGSCSFDEPVADLRGMGVL